MKTMLKVVCVWAVITVIFVLIHFVDTSFAEPQSANRDSSHEVYFIVPIAIATVAANTAFDTSTYLAFSPATDVEMYFGTADTVTFTVEAFTIFGLKPGVVVKLKTETKCLMF